MNDSHFKSGFVSLAGLPNAGKSTLLNQLAGMHLAITSPKPQTTRQVVRAIIDEPGAQMIFLDTPGYHTANTRLDKNMLASIAAALTDADIVLLVTDASRAQTASKLPATELALLERLGKLEKPVILLLNKVDKMAKEQLLPLIGRYDQAYPFAAIIPLSARNGDGLDDLLSEIRKLLPEGPQYYPVDSVTDLTEREMAAELIREQVLLMTHDEIPHGSAVEVEKFDEIGSPDRTQIRISAVIYCDKDGHKGILIGKGGSMLKAIGTKARLNIEQMAGCACFLELFVKVRPGWRNRRDILRTLGLETRA